MAGPPGIAYVYLVYGMYDCLNVVTGPRGSSAAVLIRAIEPLEGIDRMRTDRLTVEQRRRRANVDDGGRAASERLAAISDHALGRGPGLVGACFGVDPGWTGTDLCDASSALRLEWADGDEVPDGQVRIGTRVGVAYAGDDWATRPWRFAVAGHRSVSPAR
jgi:DNA-3-methyladenine glycosylase